jgi:hypothetical protein
MYFNSIKKNCFATAIPRANLEGGPLKLAAAESRLY